MQDRSELLFKKYGFEKGLDLLNVITPRQFGMISEPRAAQFVRDNVYFFTHESESLQDA